MPLLVVYEFMEIHGWNLVSPDLDAFKGSSREAMQTLRDMYALFRLTK
jgi:hypothetical protein